MKIEAVILNRLGFEPVVAIEATEAYTRTAAADLVQLQAEIEELNTHHITLNAIRNGITPVELFQSKFIKLDGTLAGYTIAMPICGGIFKGKNQDKAPIITWSGTDPD
eukprot:6298050-Ditylum_brightwellii.AAC.1